MKVKSDADTTGVKKISLIDQLGPAFLIMQQLKRSRGET